MQFIRQLDNSFGCSINCNRHRKVEISTAPTKAMEREVAYWRTLSQIKIVRQRINIQKVRLD